MACCDVCDFSVRTQLILQGDEVLAHRLQDEECKFTTSSTVMVTTARIAAFAQIDSSYSPGAWRQCATLSNTNGISISSAMFAELSVYHCLRCGLIMSTQLTAVCPERRFVLAAPGTEVYK